MPTARELADQLAELLLREHGAMADFLDALATFDRERRWVELGYPSLFLFLHRGLGLSRSSAHFRKTAAQLVQRFPRVIEPLRDGRLCITTVFELGKVITPENEQEVLPRFFRRSKQEAIAIVADLEPAPAVPERTLTRALPEAARRELAAVAEADRARAKCRATAPANGEPTPGEAALPAPLPVSVQPGEPAADGAAARPARPAQSTVSAPRPPAPPSGPRDELTPLTRERARFHVTVSRGFLEKLDAAREALSHARPGASAGDLLEAGLDLILAAHARRKAQVAKPRPPGRVKEGGVPAHVRREVWQRDRGCCQWPLEGGGICGSRLRVELDHVRAKALGGEATAEGMRLLCRFHNQLAARRVFGDAWMDRFTRGARAGEPVAAYLATRTRDAAPGACGGRARRGLGARAPPEVRACAG